MQINLTHFVEDRRSAVAVIAFVESKCDPGLI